MQAEVASPRGEDTARVTWNGGAASVTPLEIEPPALDRLDSDLNDEERDALRNANFGIQLETTWEGPALDAFVDQLRFARKLCPEAIAVMDESALQWHAAAWWDSAIEGRVPPPPTNLFTVHAVSDQGICWLHTHGLWRCGTIELEMLDIPHEAASSMVELLNVAACRMMEEGVPPPGEMLAVGQDLDVAWIPWQEALQTLPDGALGRIEDREDHEGARGVLVVPAKRKLGLFGPRWRTPTALLPTLEEHGILWVSNMETQRMSALATERFPTFAKLVDKFVDDDEWQFMVKLGYVTDSSAADGEGGSEHLWFAVHGIERGQIDATLQNEPYDIERMHAGDRDQHAIDQLSDWIVGSPWGSFRPDQVGRLLDHLSR